MGCVCSRVSLCGCVCPLPPSLMGFRSSLSQGDREHVHQSQETLGLPLRFSAPQLLFPSSLDLNTRELGTLLPQPPGELPAGTCPDRLRLGVVGGVVALGSRLCSKPHPSSERKTLAQG